MNNPFNNWLTKDEQKILGFLGFFIIAGMVITLLGINTVFANKANTELQDLEKATTRDSLVQIDIRSASAEDLIQLPGIGEKRAADIIAYRTASQFKSTEELMNIRGIGAKTFLALHSQLRSFGQPGQGVTDQEKLAALRTLESASSNESVQTDKAKLDVSTNPGKTVTDTEQKSNNADYSIVHLNSADLAELNSLDGIGDKKAAAILEYRQQIGKFTSVEQLLDVKGIGPKTLEKNRHRLSL